MAAGDGGDEVRVLQNLRGKIYDAKHLVPNKMRDFFCTINLDQEEVFRTQVVEKSLSPYFGEEFYFEIPRPFQWLSFYMYDKSVLQKDLRIGKVSIKKEDLCNYTGKENWFMLQPVDSNSEVQQKEDVQGIHKVCILELVKAAITGKVHLELKLNELITDNGSVCQQLVVHIKECHGLPLINGQNCDPYATVSLVGPSRNDQKKTKVKKKTSNPQFNETFYFEVTRSSSYTKKSQFQVEEEDIEKLEVRVDLWNNGNLVQDVFLGEIKVPVKVLRNDSFQAWYLLQPRENGNKSSKTDDLGSLRLNICYTEDCVLPSEYYTSLRNLLLKSSDVQPISASAAYILSEVCRDKYDAVLPLVRLLLHHHKLVPFIAAVAELDLKDTQEANTVFRGNTLATRCVDEMMKIVGKHYLKVTLKPVIDEICESPKPCEIDPIKLREGDNVEINMENLRYYVDKVFREIVRSSISCPTLMCDVFYSLRHLAAKRFPNDPHVQYSAVSSFVFLRFFAVAVVSPHTFHLRPHHPDAQTSRTLTLISKAIQTLGSWGSLTKSKLSSFKETFMCEFFKTFQEEKFTESVKKLLGVLCFRIVYIPCVFFLKFLDDVSSTESKEPSGLSEPVHLKEGEMYKRAQGRTRIGKKNFKKRWFCLTSRELTYHKQQDKEPIFTIPIKNILAVEKLDENSFNKKNMFQVLHGEKPLYIQANNCVEASEWIEALCRVTRCNQKRLSFYHPSAFLNGSWLCCKATIENTVGCARCTADVPADTQIEIDGDRETERIYSLFTINMSKLQKLEEACGSIAVYQGPRKEPDDYSNFTIEDSVATFHTLKQIIDTVEKLNEWHEKYQMKRSSSAKYGSECCQDLIYLHLKSYKIMQYAANNLDSRYQC
ncbi:Rasa2 [Columba guinea]|nr:Rasa2 [Columba guinea]